MAMWGKISSLSLGPVRQLSYSQQRKILRDYFQILSKSINLQNQLESLYADPSVELKPDEQTILETELRNTEEQLNQLELLAEDVLQDQISQSLKDLGLSAIPQPFPPVLYRSTDLPRNLVISPRNIIRQEKSVSLATDISLDDEIKIETEVEENTDFSALVVPVGGVSTYPTMVIQTENLLGLLETVAHEWIHNYLAFRPLGWNYSTSPALRTMNETTASIAGIEISQYVIKKFYPDLVRSKDNITYETYEISAIKNLSYEDDFNFQKEMYLTRLRVDELLDQNKIGEAEEFMESRRRIFWENGYRIRKLNQAYFAFYGAYADQSYSAAGADPVGEDVRLLRTRSKNLAEFIRTMRGLSSYQSLENLLHTY